MLTGKLFFNLLISAILEGFSLLLLVLESFKFFFKPVTKFIYFIHENEQVDRQCWFSSFVYIHVCTGLQYLVYLHVLSNVFASNYFYKDFLHHFYVFQDLFYGLSFFTKRLLHDCFPIWRIGPNLLQIKWKQMCSKTSAGNKHRLNICDSYSIICI